MNSSSAGEFHIGGSITDRNFVLSLTAIRSSFQTRSRSSQVGEREDSFETRKVACRSLDLQKRSNSGLSLVL